MTRRTLCCAIVIGCLGWSVPSQSALRAEDDVRFFESKIRPVLVKHCYECHSTESGKARGGLKVDSRDALQRGGDSGPAVVAKSLEESTLYQALLYHDDSLHMPPKGKLPQTTIDDFRQWILMGAPDPRVTAINPNVASAIDIEAGRNFWAYQRLSPTPPPVVATSNWSAASIGRTAIDRFVEAKLREQGLELAEWIASPENPLTARVIANRVWQWMYGKGLVRTVDDFGHAGETPSHPELLDFLASRLIEENWSIKALIREIALSRTWQLASTYESQNYGIDPDNRFYWRMNQRRLEAEAVRDAMLAVSGQLDLQRPLGTYLREAGEGGVGQNVFEPVIRAIDANTRSVYLPRVRSVLPEMLETFDAPDASLVTGSRDTTLTPLQSLFLMNNRFVQDQAVAISSRVMKQPTNQRLEYAYLLTLGRLPSPSERELVMDYFTDEEKLPLVCQAILCTVEFGAID